MELWDVYDINRNRIEGRTSVRGSDDMKDDEFHLVIFAAVCNSEGKLLCGFRDRNKMFGGVWEFCGGSALSGESSRQAAERELLEETGLDVEINTGFRHIVTYSPKKGVMKDVIYFVALAKDGVPVPQPEEIDEVKWVPAKNVSELVTFENDRTLFENALAFFEKNM